MTDESSMYKQVGLEMRAHTAVHHGKKQYVRHQGLSHSNTAENFFSIFKRGVIGTYHHMSEAHLARYTAEFDFRYNTRSEEHTSELQSLMRISYAVFCLKKKNQQL